MKVTTTNKTVTHVKALVYGRAGVGKTTLCATAPRPIILNVEGGLLSVRNLNLPVLEIQGIKDVYRALDYLDRKKSRKKYQTVCLDSISDIAETLLSQLKREMKDKRGAYGDMADDMMVLIRAFRDLKGYHVVMTAKAKLNEETDMTIPMMPGKQLTTNLPYLFDEVLALRIHSDTGEDDSYRYLQTEISEYWDAKDRSGKLRPMDKPDLKYIFKKILGGKK